MAVQLTLVEYIERNSIPEPNSGCHLWLLSGSADGYGRADYRRWGEQLAHRAAWVAFRGPIPVGLCVCHKCDVRACVNPDHLFLGNAKDNSDDKHRKRRANMPRGSQHGMAKLTEEAVVAIRKDNRPQRTLAEVFGVSSGNIAFIKAGVTWRHVT